MKQIRIAIIFGGCSEEHDVSVKSACEIAASIDCKRYDPTFIGITRSDAWRICKEPCANWEDGSSLTAILSPDKRTHGIIVLDRETYQAEYIDVAFSVLHGKSGEDGAIQGLLELSGIPYIGCDIQSSVICMDKSLTYEVVRSFGIKTPDYAVFAENDAIDSAVFNYPAYVKPARSGSSFGVTKVENEGEFFSAIALARSYDNKILVEQAITGYEVGCAVLGNGADLVVGEVDQITLSHGLFRIHQEEQPEGGSENSTISVPANLPVKERKRIQETAKSIYRALGCNGLARVDMFIQEDGQILLNEVNTLPGFTSYSRYPRMMAAKGMDIGFVIDRLVSLAMKE